MAKLNPRKQEAIEFIKKHNGKMQQEEIMRIASKKFGYSESTIRDLIYRSGKVVTFSFLSSFLLERCMQIFTGEMK